MMLKLVILGMIKTIIVSGGKGYSSSIQTDFGGMMLVKKPLDDPQSDFSVIEKEREMNLSCCYSTD